MYRSLLKKEESYAIHAIVSIANNPGTNAAEIAAQFEMPAAFMAKVLRKLTIAKLITSKMGRNGGTWLNCEPSKTSVLDIIQAMSGYVILDDCESHTDCITKSKKGRCVLNEHYTAASVEIRKILASILISQLSEYAPKS